MSAYDDAVAGWFDHLRGGGTRTWERWLPNSTPATAGTGALRSSSLQLELVRRLAEGGELPRFGTLADEIVATPAFGRGRTEVPLPWPEAPAYGPRPVAPEDLPAPELLRVAAPLLARLVQRLPGTAAPPQVGAGRWWRRAVTLAGPPDLVHPLRRQLLTAGLRRSGRNATRIVLAAPFEQAMFGLWADRVRAGASVRWARFWQIRSHADRVPPPLDAARLILGAPGSHLVIAVDPDLVARAVAELSGVPVTPPALPTWAAVDLRRRLNRVVEATTPAEQRTLLGERLTALLPDDTDRVVPPPRAEREWASTTAARLAADVTGLAAAGGYPVHGNPADLVGASDPGVDAPVTTADRTLRLALVAVRAAWQRLEDTR